MNIFKKLKRWLFHRKATGNQAPSYVSTGYEKPRRPKHQERTRNLVIWMGTPFSPVIVNFKDPIFKDRRR